MNQGSGNNESRTRFGVLSSHFRPSPFPPPPPRSRMASSEKDAALAAVPSDAPTIFDKIIKKEIPSTVVFEDDKAEERHIEILGYLLYVAKLVAKQEGLDDGFRIVINDGPKGCQSVYHIHVHLLGGRQMNWPPG
ncbi:adenylylsulfatase HINT1 isoform X2 [Phoenix dactylifera]|uniref:Adenylylsulfatase HINT1 isoform X2 n=1 Tax=Phoenix dactylifera TaxID=42345 RepID=A0A8B9AA10_PHODC|nr:adenylylsulfatase HINT1 isoform X2 [Phoenix dactylifera]